MSANAPKNSGKNQSIIDLIKDNPLPAALIGLGVGLLAAGSATAATGSSDSGSSQAHDDSNSRYISGYSVPVDQESNSPDYVGAKSLPRPGETAGANSGSAGASNKSNTSSGFSAGSLSRWVEDYPLAVGAVTALIGAAVGLSMPGSRLEDEWMGDTSDSLIQEAKTTVTGVVDVAKETASQAVNTAQEEFQARTGSPDDLRDNVKSTVKSAASTVTSEVKDAAKNVVDATKETAKTEAEKRGLKPEST